MNNFVISNEEWNRINAEVSPLLQILRVRVPRGYCAATNSFVGLAGWSVAMNNFVISNDIVFRREHFGAVVLSRQRQETRYFNPTAATLIESCREAKDARAILSELDWEEGLSLAVVEEFLHQQFENGVLMHGPFGRKSEAALHHLDVEEFFEDHLHFPIGVESN